MPGQALASTGLGVAHADDEVHKLQRLTAPQLLTSVAMSVSHPFDGCTHEAKPSSQKHVLLLEGTHRWSCMNLCRAKRP